MTPSSTKPPLFPNLFIACARGALIAIVLIQLYYAFGAAGFSYEGQSFSFGRMHDRQLFAIDERRAFEVTGKAHKSVAIVKYESAFLLFRLCGRCQPRGAIFHAAHFRKGNWVYTEMPWLKGPAAYNLKSGELVTLEVEAPKNSKIDPNDVPFYAEHGFTFGDEHEIDPSTLGSTFEYVSTVNEMCVILQLAGFFVIAVIALIGGVLLPIGLARRRRAVLSASLPRPAP